MEAELSKGRDVLDQITSILSAVDRFDSVSELPTLAYLSPSVRSAVQSAVQLLDDENLIDVSRQMMWEMWNLWWWDFHSEGGDLPQQSMFDLQMKIDLRDENVPD